MNIEKKRFFVIKKILILVFSIAVSFILIQGFSNNSVKADDEVESNGNETYAPLPNTSSRSIQILGYSDYASSDLRSSQTLLVFPRGFASNAKLSYTYSSTTTNTAFEVVDAYGSSDVAVRLHKPLQKEQELVKEKPYLPTEGVDWKTAAANALQNAGIAIYNATVVLPANAIITATNIAIRLNNELIKAENNLYAQSITTSSPVFRALGKESYPYGITVTVRDVNPLSSTYNQQVSKTLNSLTTSNLKNDVKVTYAMFQEDTAFADALMEEMGVAHVDDCHQSSVAVTPKTTGNVTISDNILTANSVGEDQIFINKVSKNNCKYHGSQSVNNITNKIYVFKRPNISVRPGEIIINNTEAGVIYSIGERKVLCTKDNETIIFHRLADNYTYDLVLTKDLTSGNIAYKHVKVTTPNPYYGYLHYDNVKGVQNISNLAIYNHGDRTDAPKDRNTLRSLPLAPGFVLENWYDDPTFNTVHDFKQAGTSDFHIYGKWDALKSTLNLTLKVDGSLLSGEKVELYQNGEKVIELKESSQGVYSVKDGATNGYYKLYINGVDTKVEVEVYTKRTANDVTAEQLEKRISGDTLNITVNLNKIGVYTYVDGVNTEIPNANIELFEGTRFNNTFYKNGAYYNYFASYDSTVYEVYLNGSNANPNLKLSRNNKTGRLDFNNIKVTINTDDNTWNDADVVLRKEDGSYVTTLRAGTYDPGSQSIQYTTMLLDDLSASPTKYYIYVDGVNTGEYVTSTTDGKTANLTFDTARITLNLDGSPYLNGELRFVNDLHTYSIKKNSNGVYVAHLYRDGGDYTYKIYSAIDTSTHTVGQQSITASHNLYTMKFMTSSKDKEVATYNETLFRTYMVIEGEYITPPTGVYFPNKIFNCWNETKYDPNEDTKSQVSFDFASPIDATHTLYAHLKDATVDINGFVKTDNTGVVTGSGDSFRMPNLSINGFEKGNVILEIKTQISNTAKVQFPVESDVTIVDSNGELKSDAGYIEKSGDVDVIIKFVNEDGQAKKVSSVDAADYLRRIIVTPNTTGNCVVKFTASDLPISKYSPEDWEYEKKQPEEVYTKITTGSKTEMTLNSGSYYLDPIIDNDTVKEVELEGSGTKVTEIAFTNSNGNGISINGDVKIYIPEKVQLSATGKNGSGATGGFAGISLPKNTTLTVYGASEASSILKATGGNAGNGSAGGRGGNAWIAGSCVKDGDYNGFYLSSGSGGTSGAGGGGSGAGIGTNGGTGGSGVSGGTGLNNQLVNNSQAHDKGVFTSSPGGKTGNAGGRASADVGTFKEYKTLIKVNSGNAGAGGTGGSVGSDTQNYYTRGLQAEYRAFKVSGGAGGGAGGGGQKGSKIGQGGTGGGSGGSGGAGGVVAHYNKGGESYYRTGATGGTGGYGASQGGGGATVSVVGSFSNTTSYGGGGGGSDNSNLVNITEDTYKLKDEPKYKITFDGSDFGCAKTEYEYSYFTENQRFVVPNLEKEIEGLYFKGWVVTTYGSTLEGTSAVKPLVNGDTTIYKPGYVTVDETISGDIVLKPVFEEKSTLLAKGTMTVSSEAFAPTVTYNTYTVKTTLEGEAKDVGTISLKNNADIYSLNSDGSGVYSFITTEDKTFSILYNDVDSGLTVSKGEETDVSLSSIKIKINLDGIKSDYFKSIKLVSNTGAFDLEHEYNDGAIVGQYELIGLTDKLSTSYHVYVDEEDALIDIAPGESKEINYRKAVVILTGNLTPSTAILKHGGTELSMTYDSANKILSYIKLENDDDEYKVIINNLDTGKTIKFNEASQKTNVEINECTAKVYVNEEACDDESYTPSINNSKMENTGLGTYSRTIIGPLTNIVVKGRVIPVSASTVDVRIYTVTYDLDGGVGTKPIDTKEYFKDDSVTISSLNNFMTTDGKGFVGWKYGSDTYLAGQIIKNVSSKVDLVAKYRSSTDYDILLTIDGTNRYINADELSLYLSNREEDQSIIITVLKDCALPALDLKENDNLIINQNIEVTIESLTTYGNVTISRGSTVNVTGDVNNKVSEDKTKEFVVEENAGLNVGSNFNNEKQLTNYGTIDISYGKLTNGSYSEEKIDERAIIDNFGEIKLKKFENNGYFNNKKVFTIDSTSNMNDVVNNGILTNNGGKIYGTDDTLSHPQHTMMNNNTILNDNGEIYINIYNKKNISGGEVVSPNRIILPDVDQSLEFTFRLRPNGGDVAYAGGVVVDKSDSEEHKVKYKPSEGFNLSLATATKDDYTFDGWYERVDYIGDKVTEIKANDMSSKAFVAKWKVEESANPIPVIKFTTTETVTGKGITGTLKAFCQVKTDINASASGLDVIARDTFYNSISDIKGTVDEVAKTATYPDFVVELSVNNVDDTGTTEQEAIKSSLQDKEMPMFMDIGLRKYIVGGKSTSINKTSAPIEIIIPYNVTDKILTGVVRYHNNKVQRFEANETHEDGTYYLEDAVESAGVVTQNIHIFTNQFSDFAVIYQDPIAVVGSGNDFANFDTTVHEAPAFVISYDGHSTPTIYYSSNGGEYTTEVPSLTNAGKLEIKANAVVGNAKVVGSKDYTFEVAPKQLNYATLPTAKTGLVYNGQYQDAITGGTVAYEATLTGYNAHVEYKLEDGTGEYSSTIPQVKEAGTYRVYYKIVTDSPNHTGGAEQYIDVTVAKKDLTVTDVQATTKTYDGKVDATLNCSISGKVDGDKVDVQAKGKFVDKNVGVDKQVTINSFVLVGDNSNNYKVSGSTPSQATGTIVAKDVTVTITPNGGFYGSTIKGATAVLNGKVEGDDVPISFTYDGTAYDGTTYTQTAEIPSHAGTFEVTASISDTNYNLTGTTTSEFVVRKKSIKTPHIPSVYYDGKYHKPVVEDIPGVYTVIKNEGGIGIGKYPVILQLVDNNNNRWSNVPSTVLDKDTVAETTLQFRIVKKPDPKDETCETVIGPYWHWNNEKGVCEEVYVVGTSTRQNNKRK